MKKQPRHAIYAQIKQKLVLSLTEIASDIVLKFAVSLTDPDARIVTRAHAWTIAGTGLTKRPVVDARIKNYAWTLGTPPRGLCFGTLEDK